MVMIEDGTGSGNRAQVNKEKQLIVNAITEPSIEHESEENGSAFAWCSDTVDVAAGGDTVLLVKNDSDKSLHIECIKISNGSTASEYNVHLPTTEVTVTGATVTGTNLNTGSSNVAEATAASLETNNTQGNVISTLYLGVDSQDSAATPGLIIAKNKSIAVDVVVDTGESSVTITGHFEE